MLVLFFLKKKEVLFFFDLAYNHNQAIINSNTILRNKAAWLFVFIEENGILTDKTK